MSTALLFDYWFSRNYQRLRNVFGYYLNEDAFHDAYLAMRKEVLLSELPADMFEPYFFGIYKKCKVRCIYRDERYCHPDEHFFLLMQEEETRSADILTAFDKLVYDILSFVKERYSSSDYELFRLKEYEADCSYKNLSDYAGLPVSTVYRKVNTIACSIRRHTGFASRYAYVMCNNV